jgi:hypothetical protein
MAGSFSWEPARSVSTPNLGPSAANAILTAWRELNLEGGLLDGLENRFFGPKQRTGGQ